MRATLMQRMTRKRRLESLNNEDTVLHRCLSTCDLVLLGVGGMVGSGIYVLTGVAAKEHAGPGILLSFLLAAFTVFLAATCYTEFAARIPKTGSAYLYTYISLGEVMAFLMGWGALFATMTGGATNGRTWSAYLDFLFSNSISNFTSERVTRWNIGEPIAEYPDFTAGAVILVVTMVLALGAQCSSKFNGFFACLNIGVLLFCIIVGFAYTDIDNWTSPSTGGFLPFGWQGVMAGAGACFWAFSGFEIIAVSVEEAKNPKRAIPIAMTTALTLVTVLYTCTAASLTLMTSYTKLDAEAPLPSAFASRGLEWAKYIVAIGPLCGLTTTLFSSIFSFVRITYAMAQDGLLFPMCSRVNGCSQVPVTATFIGGLGMAIFAVFFDLKNIISFGVLLSLFQYILVDACVIILRYHPNEDTPGVGSKFLPVTSETESPLHWKIHRFQQSVANGLQDSQEVGMSHTSNGLSSHLDGSLNNLLEEDTATSQLSDEHAQSALDTPDPLDKLDKLDSASLLSNEVPTGVGVGQLRPGWLFLRQCLTMKPGRWVLVATVLLCVLMMVLTLLVVHTNGLISASTWWPIPVLILVMIITMFLLLTILAHKQAEFKASLKVPCVPWIPALSIFTCLSLMVSVATVTSWVGLAVVLGLGLVLYFSYSIRHSTLERRATDYRILEDSVELLDNGSEQSDEL